MNEERLTMRKEAKKMEYEKRATVRHAYAKFLEIHRYDNLPKCELEYKGIIRRTFRVELLLTSNILIGDRVGTIPAGQSCEERTAPFTASRAGFTALR
jgi:hypothetical protein